jgi:two-component system sensor histidine kinase HydH
MRADHLVIGDGTAYSEKIVTGRYSRKIKIGLIGGAILGITVFHYTIGLNPLNHQLYGKFYYAPIIVAGLSFGLRGGLFSSVFVNLLLLPHFFMDWGNSIGGLWGILLEAPTFILVGLVTGYLSDREMQGRIELKKVAPLVSLGRTSSFVVHEMKNIGLVIGGVSRLIRRKAYVTEDGKQFLEIVERESQRMERLARDTLHFSCGPIVRKKKSKLDEFLTDIVLVSQEKAREKGIEFCFDIRGALPPLCLDSDKMKEVFVNLTENAIHATPPGGVVTLKALRDEQNVKIQITDTGTGIPPANLDKIFQPYFTTKPEGTGLGLVITKEIVEAHGGTIEVESREGIGSQFTIIFPVESNDGLI